MAAQHVYNFVSKRLRSSVFACGAEMDGTGGAGDRGESPLKINDLRCFFKVRPFFMKMHRAESSGRPLWRTPCLVWGTRVIGYDV